MGRRLLDACETNDVADVKELLSSGAVDVNCRRETDGSSGLHLASLHSHEQLLEVLLAHTGVEVNLTDLSDRTPLITACMAGHHDVVRRLCRAPGIDLNCKDSDGLAALHYAVKFRQAALRGDSGDGNMGRVAYAASQTAGPVAMAALTTLLAGMALPNTNFGHL